MLLTKIKNATYKNKDLIKSAEFENVFHQISLVLVISPARVKIK